MIANDNGKAWASGSAKKRTGMMPWRDRKTFPAEGASHDSPHMDGPREVSPSCKLPSGQGQELRVRPRSSSARIADTIMNELGRTKIPCAEGAPRKIDDLPEAFRKPSKPPRRWVDDDE